MIALALAGGYFLLPTARAPERPASGTVDATFTQLTFQAGLETFPSLSPDGKWFVYVKEASGNEDIYLQSVGGQNAINLTRDSPANDTQPAFSPDGERIAFRSERSGGGIFVMGRTGESVRRITDTGFNPAWSPDGRELVFSTVIAGLASPTVGNWSTGELWIASVETGEKRLLLQNVPAGDGRVQQSGAQPHWSPGGSRIAFTNAGRNVFTVSASGGPPVPAIRNGATNFNPVWSPDGRSLYFLSDSGGSVNLWRVALDEGSGRPSNAPERLAAPAPAAAHLTMSADGRRLAYASVLVRSNVQRLGFDGVTAGPGSDATWITTGSKYWGGHVDVSPDGNWLAVTTDRDQPALYLMHADGSGLQQLTNDPAVDRMSRWSRDGKTIFFESDRNGSRQVWRINADGSGVQQLTWKEPLAAGGIVSPDGSRLASHFHEVAGTRVFLMDPSKAWKDQTPEELRVLAGAFEPSSWSPDGTWLAGYVGTSEGIVLYSFRSREYQKLTDFGRLPRWLSDSRRLVFSDQSKLHVVDILSKSTRQVLNAAPDVINGVAVSPDGRSLYVLRGPNEADIWMATLK